MLESEVAPLSTPVSEEERVSLCWVTAKGALGFSLVFGPW